MEQESISNKRSRRRRAASVLLAVGMVGGLSLAVPSPARAEAVINIDMVGDWSIPAGDQAPCVYLYNPNPLNPTPPCPPSTNVVGTEPGPAGVGVPVVRATDGSAHGTGITYTVCQDAGVGTSVGGASAGGCAFYASGVVQGYCGLRSGTLSGSFTASGGQTWGLTFSLTNVGGILTLKGRAVEASTGSSVAVLTGTLVATAVPGGGVGSSDIYNTCIAGSGIQRYTVAGNITLAFV